MKKFAKRQKKPNIRFDVATLSPRVIDSYVGESIIRRAREKGLADIRIHTLREFGEGRHRQVDARPYGGGAGMVLMARPILKTIEKILRAKKGTRARRKIVILSAKGKQFTQTHAYEWSKKYTHIVLVSGRYEGIDERVRRVLKAEEISMGPYVLTDGDVAAMAVISAVTRLIPGVIRLESLEEESHGAALEGMEYPHYTRPETLTWPPGRRGKQYRVPKVLLSGDHKKIKEWRERRT